MKIKQLKESMEIYNYLYTNELESTLNEGWLINNDTLEAQKFKTLSKEGKIIYAMNHAKAYALNVLEWTTEEFEECYGDIKEF